MGLYYKTKRSYDCQKSHKEQPQGESLTVQGESMTISELLQRSRENDVRKKVTYMDANLDDIDQYYGPPGSLDRTDLDRFKERLDAMQDAYEESLRRLEEEDDVEEAEVLEDPEPVTE